MVWTKGFPEFAYAANSVSLLMPYAEPYFVRSVRAVLDRLDDDLQARSVDYMRQESQHQAQHRRFNELVTQRYPGLATVERHMDRTCRWLSRTRSPEFNVAFAAGAETMAYSLARWTDRHIGRLLVDPEPVPATLFLWHLAEEVEHKSAAYDVFEAVDGSRLRYLTASVMAMVLLGWFVWLGTWKMLWADGRALRPLSHLRLVLLAVNLAFELLPTMLVSALPGHHPSSFADPDFLPIWLAQYDPATGTMPLYGIDG